MALETVVYPPDSYTYNWKEFYTAVAGGGGAAHGWGHDFYNPQEEDTPFAGSIFSDTHMESQGLNCNCDPNSSPEVACTDDMFGSPSPSTFSGRKKRRRTRSGKNKEELESQRMTHIAVERNRRKQMNEYLAVIRSLMPASYVQRGDQASIIGGAINFVKELEHHLQTLEAQKFRTTIPKQESPDDAVTTTTPSPPPFADFFTFPQYSMATATATASSPADGNGRFAVANIEVTVVESHANVKILSEKRPKQLLKIVAGLQCLWITILHLNVTTVEDMVLYSLSVKLEEGCQLTTVDEIADAVNLLLTRIQEEAVFFN